MRELSASVRSWALRTSLISLRSEAGWYSGELGASRAQNRPLKNNESTARITPASKTTKSAVVLRSLTSKPVELFGSQGLSNVLARSAAESSRENGQSIARP